MAPDLNGGRERASFGGRYRKGNKLVIDWEWLSQVGSFLSGAAATLGLAGLYFIYLQWKDSRRAKVRAEEEQRTADLQLAVRKLVDEINLSSDMLLIERSKLWGQALNRNPRDFVARSVLAAAAVRTTLAATLRIETALTFARKNGLGGELLRSLDNALGILQLTGKEDLDLVRHLKDADARFLKLSADAHQRLRKEDLSEVEHEMLAFHSMEGLIQTSEVFLALEGSVQELGTKVTKLRDELSRNQQDG